MELLSLTFMRHALLAAVLIGACAPAVGSFLVQRRLALIGDGLGHVALTGVAIGLLTGTEPVWTALLAAAVGAVAIELVRARGRTSGDVALAMLFYGGIAGSVVLAHKAPGGIGRLTTTYLFGSLSTVGADELVLFGVLSAVVLLITFGLSRELFAVSQDEEYARTTGLPVLGLSLLLAVLTAATVVVSMRVVGLLLIGALIVVPVATAQLLARGFTATMALAVCLGMGVSVGGVVVSYYVDTPSGGTIVLLAIAGFAVASAVRWGVETRVRRTDGAVAGPENRGRPHARQPGDR